VARRRGDIELGEDVLDVGLGRLEGDVEAF